MNDPGELSVQLDRRQRLFAQVPVAIAILRGNDFTAEMANDAYLAIIGRTEKEFVGRPLFDSLPEIEPAVRPLLEGVMNTGYPFHGFEFEVPIHRHGKTDIAYFNFVYQPVREDNGDISGIMVVANEVTKQVEAKHFLEESERQFRNLVMQSPVAVCILRGMDLIIDIVNYRMLNELWRRSYEEVKGRPLMEVFPELKGQKYPELLQEVLRTGIAQSEKEALAYVDAADGRKSFYVEYEYTPLFQTDGSTAGVIVSVIDITERVEARKKIEAAEERSRKEADELELKVKERTRELELANNALEVKNQELTSFTYISSHDLQEPLRKIQTFASRILESEPELSSINRQYFTRIQSSAGRMQALIKDLLAYSRTNETDGYEMRDLNGMLREIRTEIRENAEKEVEILLDPLPVIRIIPFQIHQLFTNIFSNSVKFSKKDLPAQIRVAYRNEEGSHIFEVSDNGIGFQPEYSQRIFEVFQRLHSKHEYEGTGIGLSICKKIVENHHGSISARSEPGQGATITIRIPQL